MKYTLHSLAFFSLIACTILFTACGSSKKLQSSNTKKNNTKTDRKSEEKKTQSVQKKTTSTTTDAYDPLPPIGVENIFKSSYPSVTSAVWTKEMPLIKLENKNARDYKVIFILDTTKNSVIYSEKGELIETRSQILPDQLPPNVYNAIKKKYPDAHIVSAATFKNSKINGSYSAIIKPRAKAAEEKEVILTENGVFVE
jgi:hypothetical protein